MILLDTDILIDFFRGHPACRAWFASLGGELLCLSVVTSMELYAGCANKLEQWELKQKLAPYRVFWLTETYANRIIPIFADAHLSHGTGILDALIAATALSHRLPLHTFNQKHFAPFPNLKTIQPYAR